MKILSGNLRSLLSCLLLTISVLCCEGSGEAAATVRTSLGGSDVDKFKSVFLLSNGDYLIAGNTWSTDGDVSIAHGDMSDGWLLKVDSSNEIQWQHCFWGGDLDILESAVQTEDGGYLAVGNTYDVIDRWSDSDMPVSYGWIVKLDSSGEIQWQHWFEANELLYAIVQTDDGGSMAAGYSEEADSEKQNGLVVKLNASGEVEWQKRLKEKGNKKFSSLLSTANGGCLVTGSDGLDGWAVKLNSLGREEWQNHLAGKGKNGLFSAVPAGDGGYLVAGSDGSDGLVAKLSSTGKTEWQKAIGGDGDDSFYSVIKTAEGGYILAGSTTSTNGASSGEDGRKNLLAKMALPVSHGKKDGWIVKLNSSGEMQWQECLGGDQDDLLTSIVQTIDGGYVAVGSSYSNNGDISGNHGDRDGWIIRLKGPERTAFPRPAALSVTIEDSIRFSDIATGDHAAYAVVEFSKPRLATGIIDRWEIELSVKPPLRIDEIIPVESDRDKWKSVGNSVTMLIADQAVDFVGLGLAVSVADIFKQIVDIYSKTPVVKNIKFKGNLKDFRTTMIIKIKSDFPLPEEKWGLFLSGRYARPGQSWSTMGSCMAVPILSLK